MQTFMGPLRRNPANPRYFTDDSGRPVYLAGSHTWAVMQDIWLEGEPRTMDYEGFLTMMADNGHNFMRFWQWDQVANAAWSKKKTLFSPQPYLRTGPGLARDGLPKFDLTRWDETYFERLRSRIQRAGERGIYASVMLFEAWCVKCATGPEDDPWPMHPFHPDNNVNAVTDDPVWDNERAWGLYSLDCPQLLYWQQEFVKKVVDNVNDLDNVLYEICNEVPYTPQAMAWEEEMCRFVHAYEEGKPFRHPVGITSEGGDQDNRELMATSADWISPSSGRYFEYRYNPPAADGAKVIINDTDHLWGHGCEIVWVWKSFTRGLNLLFMDPWEAIPDSLAYWMDGAVTKNQRYYYLWDPCRRNLGYTRRYALKMDLNRCVPHGELCTSTYCLADPGAEYLCLLPCGGTEGLDLWDAQGQFAAEWFCPDTGAVYDGGTLRGGTRHALKAPFEGPAVLYLNKQQ